MIIIIIFKVFLENNGRVDVFDNEGKSALHLAADAGSLEVCEALLNKGAYVNSKTKTGWTSLHYAAMKGYTTLVEFLIKKHNATIDSLTMVSNILNSNVFQFEVLFINNNDYLVVGIYKWKRNKLFCTF